MKRGFSTRLVSAFARHGRVLALCVPLMVVADAAAASVVSDSAGLSAALTTARPGEVIELRSGLYAAITINGRHFANPVVVTSSDPKHPATLVGLTVNQSSGLTFSGLELTTVGSSDRYFAFRVAAADHISFSDLVVHGDRAAEPTTQLGGFYVSKSSHISIVASSFDHMKVAMTTNNNRGLTIHGNHFSFLDKGGIEMGGCSDVIVSGNTFSHFVVSRSTHPDAIQLYTAGTTASSDNVSIRENLVVRGKGDAVQGIFVQDEVGTLPYSHMEITDNAVIGGMWNSIYLKHVSGPVVLKDNLVASWPGIDMPGVGTAEALKTAPTITKFKGWISIRGDNGGAVFTETGNAAQVYVGDHGPLPGAPPNNRLLGPVSDEGLGLLHAWLSAHRTDVTLPNGVI